MFTRSVTALHTYTHRTLMSIHWIMALQHIQTNQKENKINEIRINKMKILNKIPEMDSSTRVSFSQKTED